MKPYQLAFVRHEDRPFWLQRAVSILMDECRSFRFDIQTRSLDNNTQGYALLVDCRDDNDFSEILTRCLEGVAA